MNQTVQGMRAIAMMAIFLFHCGLMPNGSFAVTFFFMVSGFGLYLSRQDQPDSQLSWRANARWQWGKLKYFYVIHLICFAASIPVRGQELAGYDHLPLRVLLSLTLTQSWHTSYFSGFNNPSWFLSTLMWVYLAAFWAVRWVRRRGSSWPWVVSLLALQGLFNLAYVQGWLPHAMNPYFFPLYRGMDFLLGMFAARCLLEQPPRWSQGTAMELLVLAALAVLYLLYRPCSWELPALFSPAFFAALCVYGQQRGQLSRLLRLRPLQWLTKYGFEFYMVQELLVLALRKLGGALDLSWRMRVILFTGGAFLGGLLFAMLCQKWLKPLLARRKKQLTAAAPS